jgi:hypothetical protein
MCPGQFYMDTKMGQPMFKVALKYNQKTQPSEYAKALGLLELFLSFLDPAILWSMRDIFNALDWNSSSPVQKVLDDLALNTKFHKKYTHFANTVVANALIGQLNYW